MLAFTISISKPETGIWCGTCLLPSAMAYEIALLSKHRVTRQQRFTGCPECGQADA